MAEPPEEPEDLDIIVTGFEVDQLRAEAGLMRVFGLDAQRARSFVTQLPVIAKRCNELQAAERYAHALRSIGARIELRPHAATSQPPPPSGHSLPPPSSLQVERMRDSVRHTSASERAIARFRATEGLENQNPASSNAPASNSIDLYNPVIPKAPALPRDLPQLPNRAHSAKPEHPDWMVSDPLELTPESDGNTPSGLRTPEVETVRSSARPSSKPTARPGHGSNRAPSERLSDRPRSVGLAHAATASGRPGLSAVSLEAKPGASLRSRWLKATAVLAAVAALAVVIARWSGQLLTEDERLVRAWGQEGIAAGEHAPARAWLSGPGHHLRGLDGTAAERLLDQLERAGATRVFAIRISGSSSDHPEASAVLVELPADKVPRRTILWQLAGARGEQAAPLSDEGQRFELLEL
jgi:hypothetical protein